MILLMLGPTGVPILQITAWMGMIPMYTLATGSLYEGVKETFDGKHPCSLCTVVTELNEHEQTSPSSTAPTKKELKLETEVRVLPVLSFLPKLAFASADANDFKLNFKQPFEHQWLSESTTPPPKVKVSSI
jgi:hypothetical protein